MSTNLFIRKRYSLMRKGLPEEGTVTFTIDGTTESVSLDSFCSLCECVCEVVGCEPIFKAIEKQLGKDIVNKGEQDFSKEDMRALVESLTFLQKQSIASLSLHEQKQINIFLAGLDKLLSGHALIGGVYAPVGIEIMTA